MFGVQRIGRYEVLDHLASGGMGQVYLARATGLGGFERQVVVKTLDPSVTEDDEAFVTMFLDEARLVGALHHQYISPVYEVGCDDDGRYYLVMDYVQGETAEAVYQVAEQRSVCLPLSFSLTVVSCIASALDYAHNLCAADGTPLDIVHRDVSLSNVMCGHDGAVRLIDFGIAKAANRATKTQTGTLKGKIGYLAPEQVLRKHVDHRADIFALGIVLYELTTGTRAFRDQSDLVTLERIATCRVRRPTGVVADYPAALERIVMKALELDPNDRYADAAAMGRDLESLAARLSVPLGHAAVIDVMAQMFTDTRPRRRIARGSAEVSATANLSFDEDELTPVTDLVDVSTSTFDERLGRAQRPTIPIVERRNRPELPLEDQPTPIAEPAAGLRARHAHIPLEQRPTPIAGIPQTSPALPAPPDAPRPVAAAHEPPVRQSTQRGAGPQQARNSTGPQEARPPTGPQEARYPTGPQQARIPTGPQLPTSLCPEDAPTMITPPAGVRHEQAAVIRRDAPMYTWLTLCGLFIVAVAVACVVAML